MVGGQPDHPIEVLADIQETISEFESTVQMPILGKQCRKIPHHILIAKKIKDSGYWSSPTHGR